MSHPLSLQPVMRWAALLTVAPTLLGLTTYAQNTSVYSPRMITGDVQMIVSPVPLDHQLAIPNKSQRVTLSFRNVPARDALRALAQRGGFNVAVDGSVVGNVSLDLKDVTIEDALEALRTLGKLVYSSDRGTLYAADEKSDKGQAFRKKQLAVIPLRYANPAVLANLLNNSLFAPLAGADAGSAAADNNASSGAASGAGASGGAMPRTVASADPRSNSLIIVGDKSDIVAARRQVANLDVARQHRTWRLNNANALNVATMLSSSLFNDGIPAINVGSSGGGASGGGSAGAGSQPASIRVEAENLQEGTGTQQTSSGQGGGGGGGGLGGGTTSAGTMPANITIRDRMKENQTLQINPRGALIVPDTRSNSITVFGTVEQIAVVDRLIGTFDRKAPQVVIEASLVEINKLGLREFAPNIAFNFRKFAFATNNTQQNIFPSVSTPFSRQVGIPNSVTAAQESLFRFNTTPVVNTFEFAYQINALIRDQKAKIISHPSIITLHDSESVISIVDEIIRSVTVTLNTGGGGGANQVSTQANIGEAGIVMSILPKIGANNTVSLRVRPTVSTVRDVTRDVTGNVVTLLSKRELVAQNVTLEDGQSFVLGGLVNERSRSLKTKVPLLGDLPIVGALARTAQDDKNRSETLIIITPHIIRDEDTSTANLSSPSLPGNQLGKQIMGPVKSGSTPPINTTNYQWIDPYTGNPVPQPTPLKSGSISGSLPPLTPPRQFNR